MTKVFIQLPVCQFCSLCVRCQWQRCSIAKTTVYTSKEFRRWVQGYRSYIMLYIARGLATEKFCDATPCRLVNSYAFTNTDGVISHKYLLVVMKVCNPQWLGTWSPSVQSFQTGTGPTHPPAQRYRGSSLYPNSGRYVTFTTYSPLLPRLRMCGAMPPLPTCVNDTALNYLSTRESSPSFYIHFCPEQFLWTGNCDDPLSCDGRTLGLFLITDWLHGRCHRWKSWIVNLLLLQ